MDERQDDVLAMMMWDCKQYTYRQRPYIQKICHLLKRIGPAESRRHLFERHNNQGTQTSRPSSACSTCTEESPVKFKASSSDDDSESSKSEKNK